MSQHVEGPRKTFKAGTRWKRSRRVKITDPATSPGKSDRLRRWRSASTRHWRHGAA